MFLMLTLFTIFGGNMYLVISNLNIGRSISSSSSGWRQGLRFLYPLPDSFFLPCNWFFNIKSSPVDSSKQIIIPFSPPGLEIGRTLILVNESWGKVYLRFLENFSSLSFFFFSFSDKEAQHRPVCSSEAAHSWISSMEPLQFICGSEFSLQSNSGRAGGQSNTWGPCYYQLATWFTTREPTLPPDFCQSFFLFFV